MIKRFFIAAVLVLVSVNAFAQENTSSPYSYFGIGLPRFKGTAENRSMGGISVFSDSIHLNLQNPAGYGKLGLTTYTVGLTQNTETIESNEGSDHLSNTTIDYIALGFPAGKWGFGFGVTPFTSVGYELRKSNEDRYSEYTGRGGLNRLYLSAGYRFDAGLRLGVEGSYNFGDIQNKTVLLQNGIQFGTREKNRSDLSGFNVKFGAQYEKMLTDKLQLVTSASYSPSANLTSENSRELATLILSSKNEIPIEIRDIDVSDTNLKIPSDIRVGAGIGQPRKWFAGAEYENISASDYSNRSFQIDNVEYKDASVYRVGGFYIPDYNDITSYFKRITFRAGLRYQGLV